MVEANRESSPEAPQNFFSMGVYSKEILESDTFKESPPDSSFPHRGIFQYYDYKENQGKVAVLGAKSDYLLGELMLLASSMRTEDLTEDKLRSTLGRFTESLYGLKPKPRVAIMYGDNGSEIVCSVPSCNWHENEACLNSTPMIFDDCPMDQWCMTYQPKAGMEIDLKNDK